MVIEPEQRGVIEVGKYYVNIDGDLLYVFGYANFEETGSITHPYPASGLALTIEEVNEKCFNALGIKVQRMVSLTPKNFDRAIDSITVWRDSKRTVDPRGGTWNPCEPHSLLKIRFERTCHHSDLLLRYMHHMIAMYSDKHDKVPAREIYKKET